MKKSNNKMKYLIFSVFLMLLSIGTVRALMYEDSCVLRIGESSATTSPIGTSKSAYFDIMTYSSSKAPTNAAVHACWTGWPYTLEQNRVVGIGQEWIGTEPQDKNSNFFVRLHGMYMNNTYARGYIRTN